MAPKSQSTESGQGAAKAPEADQTLPATGTAAATADAAGGAPSAADAGPRKGPPGYTVVVQGPTEGRWRIGRKFTAEATSIPAEEVTEAQMEALQADPTLMVSLIEAPY